MVEEGLRLSVYIGERDRAAGRLLADALLELFARAGVRTGILLRGIEGFGIKHRLASERLLTLSEDLPLVVVAADTRERIEGVLGQTRALSRHGLITLERLRLPSDATSAATLEAGSDGVKLTVYVGRRERIGGRAAHAAVVDCLHRHGVAGASVLLGVDGLAHGVRRPARFFAHNTDVPAMIQSVGAGDSIAAALAELAALSGRGLGGGTVTLERVRVCKRDGVLLGEPHRAPAADANGLAYWQKLVLYTSERSRYGGEPVHAVLVRRLRREGAAGATVLRGQWGYHGSHRPHGEAFWSIRRSVPVLTVLIDTPANVRRWFGLVDELSAEGGLVTSELVPALRSAGPGIEHGGLELAERQGRSPG